MTPSDTPLNKKTGFPTENIENPTQSGLYFRFMKNLKRLPKALFAEGCQSASFPMLGPHPTQTSARLLLSEIISQHYFRYLAGKRSEKSHFIGLLWQKSERSDLIIEDGENLHWQPPRRGFGKMHVEKRTFCAKFTDMF